MKHNGTEFPFDRTDAEQNTIMGDRVADLQLSPKHLHSSSGFFFKKHLRKQTSVTAERKHQYKGKICINATKFKILIILKTCLCQCKYSKSLGKIQNTSQTFHSMSIRLPSFGKNQFYSQCYLPLFK